MITTDFVKAFQGLVKSVVHESEKDPQKFEDLVQNVWLEICKSAHIMPKDDAAYSTWVTEIAKRTCKRHAKAAVNEVEVVLDSAMVPPSDDAEESPSGSWIEQMVPSPQTAEDDQLLHELIMRGATLSEQESAIFNLVYWHGWSHKAVADKFGISESTVRNAAMHLRDKLETKELYHKAHTYHAPGAVWGDWSWKGQNSPWVSRPDLVAAYNGEVQ